MNKKNLDIIIGDKNYDSVLLFCHGLGDHPSSWINFANKLNNNFNKLKIILLKSQETPVLINKNKIMPSWFDITEFPITKNYIDNGNYINDSLLKINKIIDQEIENGILPNKIFIGGFSQGATLSLIVGLKFKRERIGGIIILSGWIFKNNNFFYNELFYYIPIFIGHGDNDQIVLSENGENIRVY